MMCFQGPQICYALVTSEAQKAVFQSIFPRFFVRLRRICLCAMYLILNIDVCSLLVRIDGVAVKPE